MFLIFWGLKNAEFCWKRYKNSGVSIFWKMKKGQQMSKRLSQNLVQGCVKTWSKYVAQHNWTKFWLKKSNVCLFFLQIFWRISFSLQKEEYFWKKTKEGKTEENLDQVWLKNGYFWTKFWLYSAYIHICLGVIILTPLAFFVVSNLSTFFAFTFMHLLQKSDTTPKR